MRRIVSSCSGVAALLVTFTGGCALLSDADLDGIENAIDNCPGEFNQSQLDVDGDGHGDACDDHNDLDGGTPVVEPEPEPMENSQRCGGACDANHYTTCTCQASDPCGWLDDGVCDKDCQLVVESEPLDDVGDCAGGLPEPDVPEPDVPPDPEPDAGVVHTGLKPRAPQFGEFFYQGVQTAFVDENGVPCEGNVAAAVSQTAVCYRAANGRLRCAGRVYEHVFGLSFVDASLGPVDQILMSGGYDDLCIVTGGRLKCMGATNQAGQFGVGDTQPASSFVQFGTFSDVVRAATGTFDQLCVLRANGHHACAGLFFGSTPIDLGPASALFVDTGGMATGFPSPIRRGSAGRTECFIDDAGLYCLGSVVHPPELADHVVDGVSRDLHSACALTDDGTVRCFDMSFPGNPSATGTLFAPGRVLLLVGDFYSTNRCAVYDDGSLWCLGENTEGALGVGHVDNVVFETMVAPPGSVDVACH